MKNFRTDSTEIMTEKFAGDCGSESRAGRSLPPAEARISRSSACCTRKWLRYAVSLLFMMAGIAAFAQDDLKHLTFKGIPINGTLSEFVAKMKDEGFSYLGTYENSAVMQGNFAGFERCTIGIVALKATNVVNTVGVIFPKCDDWPTLEKEYVLLKTMLTKKYGEPKDCVEKFQSHSNPDNFMKLFYLKYDQCTYYATFETSEGDIQLSMSHKEHDECFV